MTQKCLDRFRQCMQKKPTDGVQSNSSGTSLIPVKQTKWQRISDFFHRTSSVIITAGGLLVGILVGYLLLSDGKKWSARESSYVGYVGGLILNIYGSLVLLLVASSVITATATLDKDLTQRIGFSGMLLIVGTNLVSAVISVALCLIIKPGQEYDVSTNGTMSQTTMVRSERLPQDFILDVIRNMFPPNYIQSVIEIIETELVPPRPGSVVPPEEQDLRLVYKPRTNQVGLTIVCVALGIAISRAGVYGHCIIAFCHSTSKFLLSILNALQLLSPLMVVSLIAAAVVQSGLSIKSTIVDLWPVMVAMCLTLVSSILLIVLLYMVIKRRLPYSFARAMLPAVLTSIGNSSSVVTLPLTLRCLDDYGVSPQSSRFLVPSALMWNWGSTAYMGVSIMFAAQLNKLNPPRWADMWKYSLIAVVAGTTVQPVPQGSIISLQFFLPALGLDPFKADIVGTLDWLMDPIMTSMNVLGGAIVATIVDDWNHKEFHRLDSFEKDLHLVANLVRLNRALEETLEEEDEEEEQEEEEEKNVEKQQEEEKVDDEAGPLETSPAPATDADGKRSRPRKPKSRKRFRRKMFGTSAVGRLLDKTLEGRPPTPYWTTPSSTPLPAGSTVVKTSGKQKNTKKKPKLNKTAEESGNRTKKKSKEVTLQLPGVDPRGIISRKKSRKTKKGKKSMKAKAKVDASELHEEDFEVDSEAIRDIHKQVGDDKIQRINSLN